MLDDIAQVPARIAQLQARLKGRLGKKEFKENCKAIEREIARLEQITQQPGALASEGGADLSGEMQEDAK